MHDLFLAAPAAVAILRGPDLVFEFANLRYHRLVGRDDLLNRPARQALPEVGAALWDRLDAARRGEPWTENELLIPIDRRGEGRLEDGYFSFTAQPMPGPGEPGVMVFAVDVTDQVRARQRSELMAAQLLASEQRLRLATAAAEIGTWEYDPATGMTLWDAQCRTLFGLAEDAEVSFETFVQAVHPDDRRRVLDTVGRALDPASDGHYATDHRIVRFRDGSEQWIAARGAVIRVGAGQPVRMVGTVMDITGRKRSEMEVALERSRLQQLFEQAPAAIATLRGPHHVFQSTNGVYRQLIGGREVLGLSLAEAFPELREQPGQRWLLDVLDGVYRTGEPFIGNEVEVRFDRNSDGQLESGVFNFVYQPMTDNQGTVYGVLVFAIEVTDMVTSRRRVEAFAAQVKTSEERYRSLIEATAQIVWTTTADGRITDDSPSWRAFTGQALDEFRAGWLDAVHPEERRPTEEAWRGALERRDLYETEYRLRRADGTYRRTLARGVPVLNEDGSVREWVGINIDVTLERQLEEALRYQNKLTSTITHNATAALFLMDDQQRCTFMNPAAERVTGLTFAEVRASGKPLHDLIHHTHPDGRPFPIEECPIDRALPTRNQEQGEAVFVRRDGTFFPVAFTASPIVEAGRPVGTVVEVRDITEEKRIEAERERLIDALSRTNEELDQFAYVASHDLKAPLRGIANLAQWLEEDLGDRFGAEARDHLQLVRGRVHRMEGLIDGILSYSRAGRMRQAVEPVDTGRLMRDVIELLAPPHGARIDVAPDLPTVRAERVPLQQVFLNLVGNALKHAGRNDPRVEVAVRDVGSHWEFAVRDNGRGIEPEYHERIWGIFQTLEARDKVEGTGIGLSLVKKIVESRGGRVAIESAPGAGATFRFTWLKEPPGTES